PVTITQRSTLREKPAVRPVAPPLETIFDLDRLSACQRPPPEFNHPRSVLRVEHDSPPGTHGLFHRQAGVVQPELVGIVDPAIRPRCPHDAGNKVGQGAILRFTGAKRLARLFQDTNRLLRLGSGLALAEKQPLALLLGALALGDIAKDGHAAANTPGLVAERP